MIYVIGDSHVHAFDDSFKKLHLSAPTAYQNYKRVLQIDKFLAEHNFNFKKDYLIFSFGEIDIRCHLGFIADSTNRTYEDVIKECVDRYGNFLQYYINIGASVGVWGVVPSGIHNGIQGNGAMSYKTHIERNTLTKIFNTYLEEICIKKNIIFRTIFDTITEDCSNYHLYFSTDTIHLNAGMFKKSRSSYIDCEPIVRDKFKDIHSYL